MNNSSTNLTNLYNELGNLKYDFRNYNLTKYLSKKIKKNNILDIGCGSGYFINLLKQQGKTVYGLEQNKDIIKIAEKLHPGLSIINSSIEHIKKINKTIEVITMLDVLEHIKDDEEQIKKIHSLLTGKGQFIVEVPAYKFLYGKRDVNLGHFRRYSKKDLKEKLVSNGFKIKKLRYWNMLGFFPYLVSEKILKKELNNFLREENQKSLVKKLINKMLNIWFSLIENHISFGFGLTLICIAEKK